MVCIIRSEPSAVPKLWVGMIQAEGESCLLPLASRPIVDHVIERARPQISSLILCPTGDPSPFVGFGLPLVAPEFGESGESAGMLAAILAGLDWTADHSRETPWVATFAAHVPVFPTDLVERLGHAIGDQGADMAWAVSAGRPIHGFGLWPVRLRRALKQALGKQPGLSVEEWATRFRAARVEFASATEPFIAIHGPEDIPSAALYISPDAVRPAVR